MILLINARRIGRFCFFCLPVLAGCAAVGPNYRPVGAQMPGSWPVIAREFANASALAPAVSEKPAAAVQPAAKDEPAKSIPAPAEAVNSTSSSSPSAPAVPVENLSQWWAVFNDPILTKLVDDGITGNLDLKQARLRIFQARASRGIIFSGLFPQISDTASFETRRTPVQIPKQGVIGNISKAFMHGLDSSWELDFFGGTRRAVEAADAEIDAAIEDRRNVMVILAGEIGAAYVTVRGIQKELAIAHENVIAQEKSVDLTTRKFKAGVSNSLDVANAKALVASTRAQIPVLESAEQQQIYSLGVLLGRDPDSLTDELNKTAPIPPPPPTIPLGLPSDLLLRRPDIRRAQAFVHAATAQIGVAKADLFPKFALTGSAGFQGAKQSALSTWASRFYTYGVNVDWQIFAAGKIHWNIELQKNLAQQAEVSFHQTVLTALQDVDSATYAYAKERIHHDSLAEEVTAYEQVVRLSLKLYSDGNSDFLNVITAQRSLYQAQEALAQSEQALSIDVVAIYKALGGGWNDPGVLECTVPAPVGK